MEKSVEKSVKNRWTKVVNKFQMWKDFSYLTSKNVKKCGFARVLQKLFTYIMHDKNSYFTSVKGKVFHVLHIELL